MTLDGGRIHQDYSDVSVTINSTLSRLGKDDHFAKFSSMGCGGACFNPVITERDLLTGRVCMKVMYDTITLSQKCF